LKVAVEHANQVDTERQAERGDREQYQRGQEPDHSTSASLGLATHQNHSGRNRATSK
jgi:hypothetical protein